MNIQQVKSQWTLQSLLSFLGFSPDKRKSRGHDQWYCSPFRKEGEPSFHIDTQKDIWMDFGLNETKSGGDLIFFAQSLLKEQGKDNSISSALEWFSELGGRTSVSISKERTQRASLPKVAKFELLSVKPIFTKALFDYLAERRIHPDIGNEFLRQAQFLHVESGRKMFGLSMANESEGQEIRSAHGFKGVVGKKDITVVEGRGKSSIVSVFEGTFDFLSRMTMLKRDGKPIPENDCIILHTNRLYAKAAEVIKERQHETVELWLDNDDGGEQGGQALIEVLKEHPTITFQRMNQSYAKYNDLNLWLTNQDSFAL